MSEISENESHPASPTKNGAVAPPVCWSPLFSAPPQQLADTPKAPEQPPASEYEKKKANFITRTIWTLVMIFGFFWVLGAGHIYIIIIVTAVQVISFKEVIAIANVPSKARSLRFTKSLNWYFLGTAMYFLYGESIIYYFKHILLVDRILLPLATHHRFISFMLYIIGKPPLSGAFARSMTYRDRFHLFCLLSSKGPLQVPVHPIRMDPYGPFPHRRTGAFRYQQHF
jgi:phosphatidate cytidylyltransferase